MWHVIYYSLMTDLNYRHFKVLKILIYFIVSRHDGSDSMIERGKGGFKIEKVNKLKYASWVIIDVRLN